MSPGCPLPGRVQPTASVRALPGESGMRGEERAVSPGTPRRVHSGTARALREHRSGPPIADQRATRHRAEPPQRRRIPRRLGRTRHSAQNGREFRGAPGAENGAAVEVTATPEFRGRAYASVLNAASKATAGGSIAASFRTNASASGAPSIRSMPASSHSTEIGPE